ncbi:BRCT domain-containing protein [Methylocystis sp. SC2]|uniref:BRCT domain-containing protein n=1 Tax=Methylocystis sp. (strain SC2) TaxID=187303 RepID=UPI00027AF016|nr:BRCT domain-containing protein [Methylocystis sp. SC2]CCJ07062.1 Probable NAD-dependent DNA ligase [Methylocystis sp. SC2]
MHADHTKYFKFTRRSRLEKSLNSLIGIVEGITIDGEINSDEVAFLETWLLEHRAVTDTHPFNELAPVVRNAIADGVISDEEKQDILWLCEKLRSSDFTGGTAADMQRLHAVLGGIMADGKITEQELRGLSDWLEERDHLRTLWPYDEVSSLVTGVLAGEGIDAATHQTLRGFFAEFIAVLDDRTIKQPLLLEGARIVGVCAVQPEISFGGSTFCFTGASEKYTRAEFFDLVIERGGRPLHGVSPNLQYLIVGAEGNPCWMYACYGRKVEKAVELRKAGARLLIVHEHDFHDAVADAG